MDENGAVYMYVRMLLAVLYRGAFPCSAPRNSESLNAFKTNVKSFC